MEIWKQVPNHPKYEVSSYGRFWSKKTNALMEGTLDKNGYRIIGMDEKQRKAHRYVSLAFIPLTSKDRIQINHKDGNKTNNQVSNLEWCTDSQNKYHAYATGLSKPRRVYGEVNGNSKLTGADVLEIRASTETQKVLAERYGVRRQHIGEIKRRIRWKHI